MMLNDSMKVFITVAEKRNFSKAAKVLNLTQPAVSFQIQMLEQYYGTILFDRVNRNITLTAAGELLLEYALHMENLKDQLEKEMQELTGKVSGQLLIGASTTIGEYILPYIVGGFKKQFPEVNVSLDVSNTEVIENKVLNSTLDIGLVEGEVKGKDLLIEDFLDDELVLVTPPDHPLVQKGQITVLELKEYPFISREKGSGTRYETEKTLKKAGFNPDNLNIIMELGSTTAIKSVVASGLGVSIISKWAAKEMVKLNKMTIIPIKDIKFRRKFIVIFNKNKFRIQAVDEFLKYLKSAEVNKILEV